MWRDSRTVFAVGVVLALALAAAAITTVVLRILVVLTLDRECGELVLALADVLCVGGPRASAAARGTGCGPTADLRGSWGCWDFRVWGGEGLGFGLVLEAARVDDVGCRWHAVVEWAGATVGSAGGWLASRWGGFEEGSWSTCRRQRLEAVQELAGRASVAAEDRVLRFVGRSHDCRLGRYKGSVGVVTDRGLFWWVRHFFVAVGAGRQGPCTRRTPRIGWRIATSAWRNVAMSRNEVRVRTVARIVAGEKLWRALILATIVTAVGTIAATIWRTLLLLRKVPARVKSNLVEVFGILKLVVAWHFAEPAWIRAKAQKFKGVKIRHGMEEHAALLSEVTFSSAHPVGAVDFLTKVLLDCNVGRLPDSSWKGG